MFRVPYDRLVFYKDGNNFKAGLKLGLEIINDSLRSVYRDYSEQFIEVADFELTNDKNNYLQGLLEFQHESGNFKILTTFNDFNSNRTLRSSPHFINTDSLGKDFEKPIVIFSEKYSCLSVNNFRLSNFSGVIPFSPDSFSLMLPVLADDINELNVKIVNDGDTVIYDNISAYLENAFSFSTCDNEIVLNSKSDQNKLKLFIVNNISAKLREGTASIYISEIMSGKVDTFHLPVIWIDKPRSLFDIEKSLDYLSMIENSEAVDNLRKASKDNLLKELLHFWKKYDPTSETSFNELMNEFYERVDYAEINFRALTANNGAKSDRGKIYIQFGNPDYIERFTDEYGRMIENWQYSSPKRNFVFIDKRGNGNFTIVRNQ